IRESPLLKAGLERAAVRATMQAQAERRASWGSRAPRSSSSPLEIRVQPLQSRPAVTQAREKARSRRAAGPRGPGQPATPERRKCLRRAAELARLCATAATPVESVFATSVATR